MKAYFLTLLAISFPVLTVLVAQDPGDLLPAFNFKVEIDGVTAGAFKSVDGISAEIEVVEFRDGADNFVRKLPGRAKFGNVTLKRGYTADTGLYEWWQATALNPEEFSPRTIVVTLIDALTENPVQKWSFLDAWPAKWKVSDLDGKGNDVLTEEVSFAVQMLKME